MEFQLREMGWAADLGSLKLFRPEKEAEVLDVVEIFYQMCGDGDDRSAYCTEINEAFKRFNQPFLLEDDGMVRRTGSEVLDEALTTDADVEVFDDIARQHLEDSRAAFFDARADRRLEGLRELYDAWERVKTHPTSNKKASNKKESAEEMATTIASYKKITPELERIMKALTAIGNKANIRHSEIGKVLINGDGILIETLFYSVYALVRAYGQRLADAGTSEPGK